MRKADGIYGMLPKDKMDENARKLRDVYDIKPDAPIFLKEFGFFTLEKWNREGRLDGKEHDSWVHDSYLRHLFGYDEPGNFVLEDLGWDIAAFVPKFEQKILEDKGDHELVQDSAGRGLLCFKGERTGFMPEYVTHPVTDFKTWEENCKWRLDPKNPNRFEHTPALMGQAVTEAKKGKIITQRIAGGYMYLRSLIGPLELMYMFYDCPELIHDCMKTWFELTDAVLARHQQYITIDELFMAEDICYNVGPLISPEMFKEFLLPYYQQIIANLKARQLDQNRRLYFQVDTDGFAPSVIEWYRELGLDYMSPFEVASGCDVVKIGSDYPDLIMLGGIDKRILAESKDAIDRHLDYIIPAMKKRGGYIPTCDHGVPVEVSFENYMHFRNRVKEYK